MDDARDMTPNERAEMERQTRRLDDEVRRELAEGWQARAARRFERTVARLRRRAALGE